MVASMPFCFNNLRSAGQAKGEFIALLVHRLLIFDLHQHGFAWTDIGDRVAKNVGTVLLGQRRLLAVLPGLFVNNARLLAFLDVANDDVLADDHPQHVDRRAIGQRIDVTCLDEVLRRVLEGLRDAGADGGPGHGEVDVDAEPHRLGGHLAIALQEQRAGANLPRSGCGGHRLQAQK